jgi:hypothetical protein
MRAALVIFFLILAGIQLVRPAKNAAMESNPALDVLALHPAPAETKTVLKAACYDCHSNNTRYPWYAEIQPFGWLLAQHVKDGKRALNFSEFGKLSPKGARQRLHAIVDEVEEKRMPLKSYTLIHAEARIQDEQIEAIIAWAEKAASERQRSGDAAMETK